MPEIRCFMLTPTDRVARWLRRYLSVDSGVRLCEPNGYHSALVRIEDGPCIETVTAGRKGICTDPMEWPADDPRWPSRCDRCGYEFHDKEVRQLFYQRIYLTPDGQETTIHGGDLPGILTTPPGAMYYADWMPYTKGPDGRCLVVMTPGGIWMIDGPSSNGPGWTRTGEPPNVTATPSIVAGMYHGWLRDGVLIDC